MNVDSSNNQDVQRDYQVPKQSVSGFQGPDSYVVLAANLSTNYSSNAQLENINLHGWSASYKDLSPDKTITIDTSQANTRIGFDGKFRLSADQLNKAGLIKLFSIVQTSDTNAYNSVSLENNDSAFVLDGKTLGHYHLSIDERTARVDANGKVTYSNWQSIGRNKFNAVYVPKRMGYHAVIKQNGKVLPKVNQVVDISADANDSVINIEYTKN